jgi:hypothetical protein
MRKLIFGIFTVCAIIVSVYAAAPQPAAVPSPESWTVDVVFEHPQQISVKLPGDKKPRQFWYVILTLTNKTGRDIDFYPRCELMTDTFQIIPAGMGSSSAVFDKIKKRHKSQYPLLEYVEQTSSKILQGQDSAKDITIIWPDFDVKAKGIKIFIAGLSNEATVIEHPTDKDVNGKAVKIYLRKTLELSYSLPGDPVYRSDADLKYEGKNWVMR